MTEAEREGLVLLRDKLSELAAIQMSSAREIAQIRLRIETLADNAQAKWEALDAVRADIEQRLSTA